MKTEDISHIIIQLLAQIAPDMDPAALKEEENFRRALELDSFDFLRFIVALQEKTGIAIPEQDYGKISSIKDLVAYIQSV